MNNKQNRDNRIFNAQGTTRSAVLFVVGDNEMKDNTIRRNIFGRAHTIILTLLMALTMVATSAFQVGEFAYAADNDNFPYANPTSHTSDGVKFGRDGDTAVVATYDQLKAALGVGGIKNIIVDPQAAEFLTDKTNGSGKKGLVKDSDGNAFGEDNPFYIGFNGPLTISREVTISSTVPVVFARAEGYRVDNSSPALLNVDSSGKLTVDGKIRMTGEKVAVDFNEGEAAVPATYNQKKATLNDASPVEYDNKTLDYLRANRQWAGFLIRNSEGQYLTVSDNANGRGDFEPAWKNKEAVVKSNADGSTYFSTRVLWDAYSWGTGNSNYPNDSDDHIVLSRDWNHTSEDKVDTTGKRFALAYNTNRNEWRLVPYKNNFYPWDGYAVNVNNIADKVKFEKDELSTSLVLSADNSKKLSDIQFIKGDSVTKVAVPDDGTGIEYKAPNFSFTSSTKVWDKSDIPGDDYRGYFINSPSGGEVTIKGDVIIGNLKTKTDFNKDNRKYGNSTVTKLAPVYIGGGSTFRMEGGEISNNELGYGALEGDSQSSVQWLGRVIRDSDPTNTAGGAIISGSGTKATITGTALISGNKADAGALIVKDGALVTMDKEETADDPQISYNIGWHHSGGVLVENNGTFYLKDGSINNNIAWWKGGAVWATEFGTIGLVRWDNYPNTMKNPKPADRKGGNFVMEGGELDSNFAFARAGALEVESNGVQLKGGTISNNRCKSLGGGIYVEGDSPIYSYTMNIRNGFISGNESVAAIANTDLDKKISNGKLAAGNSYNSNGGFHRDGDWADHGAKHTGDGGGVWLCAMGGTSVFTSNDTDARVIIDGNTASRNGDTATNNGWGDDFYISHRMGSAIVQNMLGTWYADGESAENGDEPIKTSLVNIAILTGPKGMYNADTYTEGPGIQIINNKGRNGGGIAANGTIILGKAQSVYRYETELNLKKDWKDGLTGEGETVKFELYYEYQGKEYKLTSPSGAYEVTLGTTGAGTNTGNEVMYKTGQWTAKATVPAFVTHKLENGETVEVPLFEIEDPENAGTYLDLSKSADIQTLFERIGAGEEKTLNVKWNIRVKETGSGNFESKTVPLTTATGTAKVTRKVELKDPVTGEILTDGTFSVNFSTITFAQTVENRPKKADIKLTKVDGTTKSKIAWGTANFTMYEANMTPATLFDNEGKFVSEDIHVSVKSATPYRDNISSQGGEIAIDDVDSDKVYLLFETQAPTGYDRTRAPWLIWVKKDATYRVFKYSSDKLKAGNDGIQAVDRDADKEWTEFKKNISKRWYPTRLDFETDKPSTDASYINYDELTGSNAGKLANNRIPIELIKYKSVADGESVSEKLSGARFMVLPLTNINLTSAQGTITPKRNELSLLTSNDIADGQRVFITDSKDGSRYLFAMPTGDNNPIKTSGVKKSDYEKQTSEMNDTTFYLEKHVVDGVTLYAFRNQAGRYLSAESGVISEDSFWAYIRSNSTFQSGEYTTWEKGIRTSLFKIESLEGSNGMDIRAYWHGPDGVKENKVIVKTDSGTYLASEKVTTTTRGIELYKDTGDIYMTETDDGIHKINNLENGYYQIIETVTPDGYQRIANSTTTHMIIKIEDGEVSVVNGSDVHFSKGSKALELRMTNDELTSRRARKVWGDSTGAPSSIQKITFNLYSVIGDSRTLVDSKDVTSTDWNKVVLFDNLPKYTYVDGRPVEIGYDIKEEAVPGYIATYEESGDTTVVTNKKFKGGKVKLTIDKTWLDESNKPLTDDSLKKDVEVEIYYDSTTENVPEYLKTVTLTADNNWILTLTGDDALPMYAADGSRKLKYWIKEKSMDNFTSVATTEYQEATETQSSYEQGKIYTGRTWDNVKAGGYSQYNAGYNHTIVKDGAEEIVYCINTNYKAPETGQVQYKRIEITSQNAHLLKNYMQETDNRFYYPADGQYHTAPRTYSVAYKNQDDRNPDYTKLYYALLKLAYYGYGGQDNDWLVTKNLDPDLIRHLTQYAFYEYTDYNFYTWHNGKGYDFTEKDRVYERHGVLNGMQGNVTYGPYGLIVDPSTKEGYNYRIQNQRQLQSDYLALLGKIEATSDSDISKLGLKLYIYEPIVKTNQGGRRYQNLIGVETAEVNKYASISNKLDYSEITLYKHSSKNVHEALGNVEFDLYEEVAAGTSGSEPLTVGGETKTVIRKNAENKPYKTSNLLNKGKVKIEGLLNDRNYYLVERRAADGYILLSSPIAFTLSNSEGSETYNWSDGQSDVVTLKAGASITTTLNVANEPMYELPKAGGMGTYWFMVIGSMMMGFGATVLLARKKRSYN